MVLGVTATGREPALPAGLRLQPGSLTRQDTLDGEKEWVGWEGFCH